MGIGDWIGEKWDGLKHRATNWVKRKITNIAKSAGESALDGLKSALPQGASDALGGLLGGDSPGSGVSGNGQGQGNTGQPSQGDDSSQSGMSGLVNRFLGGGHQSQGTQQQGDTQDGSSGGLFGGGIGGFLMGVLALVGELLLWALKGLMGLFGMGSEPAAPAATDNLIDKGIKGLHGVGHKVYDWAAKSITKIAAKATHSDPADVSRNGGKTSSPVTVPTGALQLKGRVSIDTDGSRIAFNPNTEAGRIQIRDSGPSGFVTVEEGTANSAHFTFKDGKTLNLAVDPNTGNFISKTSLVKDANLSRTDQERYMDPESTRSLALSREQAAQLGVKVGDKLKVTDANTGQEAVFVFGDGAGNRQDKSRIEMSPAGANEFGISVDARGYNMGDKALALIVEPLRNDPTATAMLDSIPANAKKRITAIS
jgi:formylmethanofuran dehydrogenase subunit D